MRKLMVVAWILTMGSAWAEEPGRQLVSDSGDPSRCMIMVNSGSSIIFNSAWADRAVKNLEPGQTLICAASGAHDITVSGQ